MQRKLILGAQVRAARGLLGWTVHNLARRAAVSIATVHLIEDASGLPSTIRAQLDAVEATLQVAGIEFLAGPGVRLRPKGSKRKG